MVSLISWFRFTDFLRKKARLHLCFHILSVWTKPLKTPTAWILKQWKRKQNPILKTQIWRGTVFPHHSSKHPTCWRLRKHTAPIHLSPAPNCLREVHRNITTLQAAFWQLIHRCRIDQGVVAVTWQDESQYHVCHVPFSIWNPGMACKCIMLTCHVYAQKVWLITCT